MNPNYAAQGWPINAIELHMYNIGRFNQAHFNRLYPFCQDLTIQAANALACHG